MPISDKEPRSRLPRLGKLRIGMRAADGRPMAVDHFVGPEEFHAIYGPSPRSLEIMFPPYSDLDDVVSDWYRRFGVRSHGQSCKGDGERAHAKIDVGAGGWVTAQSQSWEWREIACGGSHAPCPEYEKGRCREVMFLRFMLPEMPGMGVWQLDTSSEISRGNVGVSVHLLEQQLGSAAMIPMRLDVVPMQVTPSGQKAQTVYVLTLRAMQSLLELVAMNRQRLLLDVPLVVEAAVEHDEPVEVEVDEDGAEPAEEEAAWDEEPPPIVTDLKAAPAARVAGNAPPLPKRGESATVQLRDALSANGLQYTEFCDWLRAQGVRFAGSPSLRTILEFATSKGWTIAKLVEHAAGRAEQAGPSTMVERADFKGTAT